MGRFGGHLGAKKHQNLLAGLVFREKRRFGRQDASKSDFGTIWAPKTSQKASQKGAKTDTKDNQKRGRILDRFSIDFGSHLRLKIILPIGGRRHRAPPVKGFSSNDDELHRLGTDHPTSLNLNTARTPEGSGRIENAMRRHHRPLPRSCSSFTGTVQLGKSPRKRRGGGQGRRRKPIGASMRVPGLIMNLQEGPGRALGQ